VAFAEAPDIQRVARNLFKISRFYPILLKIRHNGRFLKEIFTGLDFLFTKFYTESGFSPHLCIRS
jgi:hypothetical protein